VPSGGAAAEEGQGAVNALDKDCSFDSFDASRFDLLDSLHDSDRVAIASAYDWDGGVGRKRQVDKRQAWRGRGKAAAAVETVGATGF
jgi:hypothetical protein